MIKLRLAMPVSKNARHIPIRCGKWMKLVRSKACKLKERAMVEDIWKQIGGKPESPCFTRPVSMFWTLTPPDRRPRDLCNYAESLCDCLQEAGVLADDKLIVHEGSELMPVPSKPGFVEVTLEEIP